MVTPRAFGCGCAALISLVVDDFGARAGDSPWNMTAKELTHQNTEPKTMKLRTIACLTAATVVLALGAQAQNRARTEINVPDIPGYVTLKCDFHIHTVFSDGTVWPNIRADEAWRDGMDAIAITDHIEYQPHKDDLPTKHNRSYEIAKAQGDTLGVIVIRGAEITRSMPPGHFNAVFLKDAEALATPEWRDSIDAAIKQGAFIFWNHPGWTGQQPDGVGRWYAEHDELLAKGAMHGIEVVNGTSYYPEAHKWCLEKKLTMLCNSDEHTPISFNYGQSPDDHRPITLVFAAKRTASSIKDALVNRRTAVYSKNLLVGEEQFLNPIFERSIRVIQPPSPIKGTGRVYAQIRNSSDITYQLRLRGEVDDVTAPGSIELIAGRTVLMELRGRATAEAGKKTVSLPYRVENLLVAPDRGLDVTIKVEVELVK